MNDDVIKQKYFNLMSEVNTIKTELMELQDIYNNLYIFMNEGILINDKVYNNDIFLSLTSDIDSIENEIVNVVIPSINNKL